MITLSGLFAFCGKQGKGKTYSCIKSLEKILTYNYILITNMKSYNNINVYKQIYEPDLINIIKKVEEIKQDEELKNYRVVILFDEIFTYIEKKSVPKEVLEFLAQMRKREIVLMTTAQEWLEINVTLRRFVRYQINCNMINIPILNFAICINQKNDGEQLKWSVEDNDYIAPTLETNVFKVNKCIIEKYDTFEKI